MPSPDELRALAERVLENKPRTDWYTQHDARQLLDSLPALPSEADLEMHLRLAYQKGWQHSNTDVPALADALLELLQENERLRYSHLPEAVEEPSDLENDFYDSATEGYSSNSRGMEHDDDGT